MQGGLVARKVSVRPSVCLSDKRVNCDKTVEKSVKIFIYLTKYHLTYFSEEKDWSVVATTST